jgi:hypothetical protein
MSDSQNTDQTPQPVPTNYVEPSDSIQGGQDRPIPTNLVEPTHLQTNSLCPDAKERPGFQRIIGK